MKPSDLFKRNNKQGEEAPLYAGDRNPMTIVLLGIPASKRVMAMLEYSQKYPPKKVEKPASPYTAYGTGGDTFMGCEDIYKVSESSEDGEKQES